MKQILVINFLCCIAASMHMAADPSLTQPTILEGRFNSFTADDISLLANSIDDMIFSHRYAQSNGNRDTQFIIFMDNLRDYLEKESKQWKSLLPSKLKFIPHCIEFLGNMRKFLTNKNDTIFKENIIILSYFSIKVKLLDNDWKIVRNFFKFNSPAIIGEQYHNNYAHKLWEQFIDIVVDSIIETSDEWRNIISSNEENNLYFDDDFVLYNKTRLKEANMLQRSKIKKIPLSDIQDCQLKDVNVDIFVAPKFDDAPVKPLIFDFKTPKDSMSFIAELRVRQLLLKHNIFATSDTNKAKQSLIAEWIYAEQQQKTKPKSLEVAKSLPKPIACLSSKSAVYSEDMGLNSPRLVQSAPGLELGKQAGETARAAGAVYPREHKRVPISNSMPPSTSRGFEPNIFQSTELGHQQYLSGSYRKSDSTRATIKNNNGAREIPLLQLSAISERDSKDSADNNNKNE